MSSCWTSSPPGFSPWRRPSRQDTPKQLAAARPGLVPHAADGLGNIIAALQAAGALSLFSSVPGQLAGLYASLGASGHGITAPPGCGYCAASPSSAISESAMAIAKPRALRIVPHAETTHTCAPQPHVVALMLK